MFAWVHLSLLGKTLLYFIYFVKFKPTGSIHPLSILSEFLIWVGVGINYELGWSRWGWGAVGIYRNNADAVSFLPNKKKIHTHFRFQSETRILSNTQRSKMCHWIMLLFSIYVLLQHILQHLKCSRMLTDSAGVTIL